MSSILKALRRLEEERARKNHVAPEIATSLLRSRSTRRTLPLWTWPTLLTAIALLFMTLLFWIMRPPLERRETGKEVFAAVLKPTKSSMPATGTRGEVIIEEVMEQRSPAPLAAPDSPPPHSVLPSVGMIPAEIVPSATLTPVESVNQVPPASKPVVASIEERQRPLVSAIAWQDDSSARMAVIEGLPMMTGEMIGAAKVQEIQADRILFNEDGVLFLVRLHQE